VVTRRWPEEVEQALLGSYDAVLNLHDRPFDPAELQHALETADAVLPTVTDAVTAEVLGGGRLRVRILGNLGVGFSHIDIDAARARGLVVTNTPGVLTDCTADLAMTLILMVARRAGEGERHLRAGEWQGWRPTHLLGTRVTGKVLGLVGFGRIARAVAHRAHFGFGMQIRFYSPSAPEAGLAESLHAVRCDSADQIFGQSDFVSLHCPGGAATRHLVDAGRLALMQPHAFLVNTARGEVVDTAALIEALRAGRIAGAALDVYEGEPAVPEALRALDNVVLLPHLGSATRESRVAMGMRVLENLDDFFGGREPRDRVA